MFRFHFLVHGGLQNGDRKLLAQKHVAKALKFSTDYVKIHALGLVVINVMAQMKKKYRVIWGRVHKVTNIIYSVVFKTS